MKIRTAAFRVKQLYPGVVGEVLERELLAWEDFGYRLANDSRISRLVNHIMSASTWKEAG